MPVKKPLLGITSFGAMWAEFRLTDDDWRLLEVDFVTVSKAARDKLAEILQIYLFNRSFEEHVAPVDEALKHLKAIGSAAQRLQGALSAVKRNTPDGGPDYGFESAVFDSVQQHFPKDTFQKLSTLSPRFPNENTKFILDVIASSIIVACNLAIKDYRQCPEDGNKKGFASEKYFRDLISWGQEFGLPVTITSDSGTYENWKSDFQSFAEKLNGLLPTKLQPSPSRGKGLTKKLLLARKQT